MIVGMRIKTLKRKPSAAPINAPMPIVMTIALLHDLRAETAKIPCITTDERRNEVPETLSRWREKPSVGSGAFPFLPASQAVQPKTGQGILGTTASYSGLLKLA